MYKDYFCRKCGSEKLKLEMGEDRVALKCAVCNSWIKWVKKNEVNSIEEYISGNKNVNEETLLELQIIDRKNNKVFLKNLSNEEIQLINKLLKINIFK